MQSCVPCDSYINGYTRITRCFTRENTRATHYTRFARNNIESNAAAWQRSLQLVTCVAYPRESLPIWGDSPAPTIAACQKLPIRGKDRARKSRRRRREYRNRARVGSFNYADVSFAEFCEVLKERGARKRAAEIVENRRHHGSSRASPRHGGAVDRGENEKRAEISKEDRRKK